MTVASDPAPDPAPDPEPDPEPDPWPDFDSSAMKNDPIPNLEMEEHRFYSTQHGPHNHSNPTQQCVNTNLVQITTPKKRWLCG